MDAKESTVTLISSDGETFTIPSAVASMSELIKSTMEDDGAGDEGSLEFPLPKVEAKVLKRVIAFCEHHVLEPMPHIEMPLKSANMAENVDKWYADFAGVDQVLLFELLLAANYMDIKPLLSLTCATVGSQMKGKTPEQIRSAFTIHNDFTPEEEAQVRKENKWCQEE